MGTMVPTSGDGPSVTCWSCYQAQEQRILVPAARQAVFVQGEASPGTAAEQTGGPASQIRLAMSRASAERCCCQDACQNTTQCQPAPQGRGGCGANSSLWASCFLALQWESSKVPSVLLSLEGCRERSLGLENRSGVRRAWRLRCSLALCLMVALYCSPVCPHTPFLRLGGWPAVRTMSSGTRL